MTHRPNFPDYEEAQWQAQEHARLAVREGTADADASDLRVARALRQAPPIGLPIDFAAQVAGLARVQATNNSLFEQRLLRGLSVLFGLSALVTVAWFGRSWPADLAAILPGGSEAASWSMAAGLCVLGNWALTLLRRKHEERDAAST
ncbi:hypothetical protein [Thermomonas sp.]|uniref:hypothetical protein n=1 Tax=Thermomonas sp. TaxID=1971895 RepID=UPI0024893F6B|nr:hypothetical protein [Thermomonas sp.]MDI1252656.1 hypothetical protein [Thermomonas sp.]